MPTSLFLRLCQGSRGRPIPSTFKGIRKVWKSAALLCHCFRRERSCHLSRSSESHAWEQSDKKVPVFRWIS